MTTIILTIIGILLAAAAALMVIFYGGDAFNAGSVGAQANTLQNAGTNVISAVQLYKADGASAPTTVSSMETQYLKELPALPASSLASDSLSTGSYLVSGVDASVCARVNTNLKNNLNTGTGTTASPYVAPATQPAGSKMGCAGGNFYATI